MNDLVLRTRLQLLQRNLLLVNNLDATVRKRQARIQNFITTVGGVRTTLNNILNDISAKEAELRAASDEAGEESEGMSDDAQELLDMLFEIQTQIRGIVDNDLANLKKRADTYKRRTLAPADRKDVADLLIGRAENISVPTDVTDWQAYKSTAEECEQLFSEYVDLLRGIALRDADFDDNFFEIAERLPALWDRIKGWGHWASLAIPARFERNASTTAYVLRIGFPEWTVWALPLVQHEFGHIVVEAALKGDDAVLPSAETDVDAHRIAATLLADASATYITGPSYVCAVLLMRLDPVLATANDREHGRRAAVTLEALRTIAARVKAEQGDSPLEALEARLRAEWLEAVDGAGGDADAMSKLLTSEETQRVVDAAWTSVAAATSEGKLPLWARRWSTVTQWSERLRAYAKLAPPPESEGNGEELVELDDEATRIDLSDMPDEAGRPIAISALLSAAWLTRVHPTGDDITDADELLRIEARTLAYLGEIGVPPAKDGKRRGTAQTQAFGPGRAK